MMDLENLEVELARIENDLEKKDINLLQQDLNTLNRLHDELLKPIRTSHSIEETNEFRSLRQKVAGLTDILRKELTAQTEENAQNEAVKKLRSAWPYLQIKTSGRSLGTVTQEIDDRLRLKLNCGHEYPKPLNEILNLRQIENLFAGTIITTSVVCEREHSNPLLGVLPGVKEKTNFAFDVEIRLLRTDIPETLAQKLTPKESLGSKIASVLHLAK